jgi:polyisoprenoid-binding protein YceI
MNTITVDDLEGDMQAGLLKHLQGDDFFAVAANPTSTFTITTVKEIAPNSYEVTGDLTIKGITNPVTFVASVDATTMTFTAPIVIDRTLWDIKFRSLKFFSDVADKAIDDTITYDVTLTVQ